MEKLSKEQLAALFEQCEGYYAELKSTGQLVEGTCLVWDTVSLRPTGGKPLVSDGPFVETKEKVGGLVIIEARDLNDAIRVASLHPAARMGADIGWAIEIRPIGTCEAQVAADELAAAQREPARKEALR
jgi:hypothetical protein